MNILFLIFFIFSTSLHARVTENVIGTDYFEDVILSPEITTEDELIIPEKKFKLSNLNLCYGAELFASHAIQTLYNNGDVIRVKKQQITTTNRSGQEVIRDIYTTHFYNKIEDSKNPKAQELTYQEINPLALLCRILFYQIPDTESLSNFRVSECFRTPDALELWAHLTATAVKKVYEFEQGSSRQNEPNLQEFETAYEKLNCNLRPKGKKHTINFSDLIKRCIQESDTSNFGAWFPVKILIAGAYEQFGHEKALIQAFYQTLHKKLLTIFCNAPGKISGSHSNTKITTALTKLSILESEQKEPNPNSLGTIFAQAYTDYINFEPLTYGDATLEDGTVIKDCFENTIRNICLRLILIAPHDSFDCSVIAEDFRSFFETYNSMYKQGCRQARNEWAQLLFKYLEPICFYDKTTRKNEMVPSIQNFFICLNKIFDLQIESITNYQNLDKIQKKDQPTYLQKQYQELQKALKDKLENKTIYITTNPLQEKEAIVGEIKDNNTTILNFSINYQAHADIIPFNTNEEENNKIVKIKPFFPYLTVFLKQEFNQVEPWFSLPLLYQALPSSFDFYENENFITSINRIVYASTCQHFDRDFDQYKKLLKFYALVTNQSYPYQNEVTEFNLTTEKLIKYLPNLFTTFQQLKKITLANDSTIKTLDDLSYPPTLQSLIIRNFNKLRSCNFASNLENLEILELKDLYNHFSLEGFKNLTNLKKLKLDNLNFTDLQPLKYLTNLESLTIIKTHLRNDIPISTLKNLKSLHIETVQGFESLVGFKELQKLESLTIKNFELNNIEELNSLKNLKTLYIEKHNDILRNFPFAQYSKGLISLEALTLRNCQIFQDELMQPLPSLKSLTLYYSDGLSAQYEKQYKIIETQLNHLETLTIENCYITTNQLIEIFVSTLKALPNLPKDDSWCTDSIAIKEPRKITSLKKIIIKDCKNIDKKMILTQLKQFVSPECKINIS